MSGPFATASRRIAIHQVSLLSHAACASMSTTTTTTTTTRDRGDRYGPIEWAQILSITLDPSLMTDNCMNTLDISLTLISSFGNSIKMHTELNIVNFRQLYSRTNFHLIVMYFIIM